MIDWDVLDPRAGALALDGLGAPWWVCGGWALERYTAVRGAHDRLVVGLFHDDLPALRAHFAGADVRAVVDGFAVPLPAEVPATATRLWVRAGPDSPWQLDVRPTRRWRGRWVFARDPSVTYPLDEATWVEDGLRYLNPELVLLFRSARTRTTADLDRTLPWLRAEARERLFTELRRLDPDHPWLALAD
ncbi:hypothetical protein CLV43_101987 [Umezawaea tangerina]|uniref:Amino acid transporter n=2 Tax=Umezawaea tangerina TaxID=84725 RepID=A0A2T0TM47_9PSEU|nr:hypothetical protein CLV43_101987 [Umezawaea tangerina]